MKDNEPLITIVVPVYKAEQYLPTFFACMSSQSFQRFQCIFAYDVSPDGTLAFLKSHLTSNQYLLVEKPTREGTGRARDYILDHCQIKTKYVLFLDVDDKPHSDYLEKLVASAENTQADMTICGYRRIDAKDGHQISEEMIHNPAIIDDLLNSSIIPYINPAPWNKLLRTEIISDARFIYPGGTGEDTIFLAKVLPNVRRISFVNEVLYDYFVNFGSASSSTDEKMVETTRGAYVEAKGFYIAHGPNFQKVPICTRGKNLDGS
jgi:glycosyltransferase EpsH